MSDEDEDSFVSIGQQLQPIESDVPKKAVRIEDMAVVDSRGRQRFHGAFTGGFSAGFFNTVGSKEGFTPATFHSSRGESSEGHGQRPEDFMDDEDFSEYGIAPRMFAATEEFTAAEDKNRKRPIDRGYSAIPGDPELFADVIETKLSIGVKLLRKMGWKEGQGVGPRVKRKPHRSKTGSSSIVRTYGCSLPGGDNSVSEEADSDDSDLMRDVTFAPKDTTTISFLPKDNSHGIGYSGINPRVALTSGLVEAESHLILFDSSRKARRGIKGKAFGVGALEDDDDDIYSVDSMSNYTFTLGDTEADNDPHFGWTAPKHLGKASATSTTEQLGKLLDGFTLSSKPHPPAKVFPPPHVPHDYRPYHQSKKQLSVEKQAHRSNSSEGSGHSHAKKLTAYDRRDMLGETPQLNSVFELVPKESQDKMKAFQAISSVSINSSQSCDLLETESREQNVQLPTKIDSQSAGTQKPLFQASITFKPFAKDAAKQSRYDAYVQLIKQGNKDAYEQVVSGHMTEWEREREREEFQRARHLYKPMSGMMASRFTSAKHNDVLGEIVDVPAEEQAVQTDQEKAAEMKLFGQLTHEKFEWHPDRILCKRFNIPDPYPGSSIVGLPTAKQDKYSVYNFLNFLSGDQVPDESANKHEATTQAKDTHDGDRGKAVKSIDYPSNATHGKVASSKTTMPNIFTAYLEQQDKKKREERVDDVIEPSEIHSIEETTTTGAKDQSDKTVQDLSTTVITSDERPPMDLFKAIFQNTDSEEESSSSDAEPETEEHVGKEVRQEEEQITVTAMDLVTMLDDTEASVHESATSGLAQEVPGSVTMLDDRERSVQESVASRLAPEVPGSEQKDEEEEYGPRLPPALAHSHIFVPSSKRCQSALEAGSIHRKQKHKHKDKSKHKEKKKKLKHKKQKHKKHTSGKGSHSARRKHRHDSSDDSSRDGDDSDSNSDNLPTDTEILNKLRSVRDGLGQTQGDRH